MQRLVSEYRGKRLLSKAKKTISKPKQLEMLKKQPLAYGGELMKTRKGRAGPRTLSTKDTMHLVLRSSLARGDWSFSKSKNKQEIKRLFEKFSARYYVKVLSIAYVGNHLHCHIQLFKRGYYKPFIRALTAAIAMAVSGASRWNNTLKGKCFWDYRPFTRVVKSYRALLNLRDYIQINQYEGSGYTRGQAQYIVLEQHVLRHLCATGS